ncbi:hypothetical protein DFQ26_003826 [Actinomortierella ambigua]|nr:hypothetical protein DFQ26_003826 [Actinomortierella ambigua]
MADYLTLIQSIRWGRAMERFEAPKGDSRLSKATSRRGFHTYTAYLRHTVTWSICGHRLGEIRELEMEPNEIQRFVDVASELCRLHVIFIATRKSWRPKLTGTIYPSTLRFIQTLQQHHGKDQLRECHFAYDAGNRDDDDDDDEDEDEDGEDRDIFRWNLTIAKQLPPRFPRGLQLALPLRPMDAYLSRLETLATRKKVHNRWQEISEDYSDMSVGQMLQRCRSLLELQLNFDHGEIDDPNVLAWAADEARERAAGRLLAPAVPLEELILQLKSPTIVNVPRMLMDAIHGFSQTLVILGVTLGPQREEEDNEDDEVEEHDNEDKDEDWELLPLLQGDSIVLPKLAGFIFGSDIAERWDPRILRLGPNLNDLSVSLSGYRVPWVRPPVWPRLYLPHLTQLELHWRAVNLFDPASLHDMPRLQGLQLYTTSRVSDPPVDALTFSGCWTWDWDLPELETLILHMEFSEVNFSFRVLRGCPKLREMHLVSTSPRCILRHQFDVASVLVHPTEDVFYALEELVLAGRYRLQPEDLQTLLEVLPGLRRLELETVRPCTAQQAVEFTRHHPSLVEVIFRDVPLFEKERRDLGFVECDPGDPPGSLGRCLYKDPLRYFRDLSNRGRISESQESLLRLLLSLSPATDDDTNLIRDLFDVPRKHASRVVQPRPRAMADYLTLIQSIRWGNATERFRAQKENDRLHKLDRPRGFSTPAAYLRHTMTWSICGHRLGEIRELEMEPNEIQRFVDVASKLCRLQVIFIATRETSMRKLTETIYPPTLRLIQTLQQHHGKDQIRDCHFAYSSTYERHDIDVFRLHTTIIKQLPPRFPRGLHLALPLRPMDAYLSRLKALMTRNFPDRWRDISEDYSDMTVGQLLQRCRSLLELQLDFDHGQIDDPNLLTWAADEARERAAGRLLAPAVPLVELGVQMESRRTTVSVPRMLMDGIRGFSQTLRILCLALGAQVMEDVEVVEEGSDDENEVWEQLPLVENDSVMLPKLESLIFMSDIVERLDSRLLQLGPNLDSLFVNLYRYCKPGVPPPIWPRLYLPYLTQLELRWRAVNLFDPTSLHYMPRLQELHLFTTGPNSEPSADALTFSGCWTWDWELPELETLDLRMGFSEINFSFGLLRGCPKLREVNLVPTSARSEPWYRLEVASTLTNPMEDIFPALTKLVLAGRYCLQPQDLQALVGRVLPGLKWLEMETVHPCTAQQVIELTRDHSSLEQCLFRGAPLSQKERCELGLVKDDSPERPASFGSCLYTLDDERWRQASFRLV